AAEPVLPAPGLVNESSRACEHATHRAAEPFRQVQPDAVAVSRHVSGGNSGRDDRIEQPRAIHMHCEPGASCRFCYLLDARQRPDGPTAAVYGLLDDDQPRSRRMTARLTNGRLQIGGGENAPLTENRPSLRACQGG